MSERTALEVAAILEDSMPICGRAAVIALRRQHAEIERLTALNSALTAKANALVIANARLDEKIDSLTAERDTAIAAAVAAEREARCGVRSNIHRTIRIQRRLWRICIPGSHQREVNDMSYRASFNKPYTVGCSHDKKYYVQGPAPFGECSFYAGTPHSGLRFENEDDAKVAVQIANVAFEQGKEALRCEIKALLQIN